MNEKKKIPVTDKKSGKQWFTEAVPQHKPRESVSLIGSTLAVNPTANANVAPEPQSSLQGMPQPETLETVEVSPLDSGESTSKAKSKPKPKQEITSLEQLIAHAYERKGKPLLVKPKLLQEISPNTQISSEGFSALQMLAVADKQFCVPRQILLAILEIDGFPAIKEGLRSFVETAMNWNPIFKNPKVAAAIKNLPDAPLPFVALKLVMKEACEKNELEESDSEKISGDKASKRSVYPYELRVNAANCLAVWFVVTRQLSLEDVTDVGLTH